MMISSTEPIATTCPACGTRFTADVWTLVDASERPDLAQALRDGEIDQLACPKCGEVVASGAPLLFHDPAARRVYFAVPPDAEEHAWRERAQQLLYALVAAIPEDQRLPYLGDVQVEHEIAGVRRAIGRNDRRRRAAGVSRPAGAVPLQADSAAAAPPPPPAPAPPASQHDQAALLQAAQGLLTADSQADFASIVDAHPALLSPEGDAVVRQLADIAYAEGQREIAGALHEIRATLSRLRSGQPLEQALAESQPAAPAPPDEAGPAPTAEAEASPLAPAAYQALLGAESREQLVAATRDYPVLLEEVADAALAARADAALDEGNERLAHAIEARREVLFELRDKLAGREALHAAVRALVAANGEDAVAATLAEYPILLTQAAQAAVADFAAGAQARGDERLSARAAACGAMLRVVRAGLEET